jgi:hypothetical protein
VAAARMGRPSVYPGKDRKNRHQGIMTDAGEKLFERHRHDLQKLTGIEAVSDGDVFEYMARGPEKEKARLAGRT